MITYKAGDIFKSNADCLVNPVNCESVMGKGLAYQFKMRFPRNNEDYVIACKSGRLHIGTVHYFVENGITIINFPTKNKWRDPSRIEYIESGLDAMLAILPDLGVKKVAVPPLGCGNGGLDWNEVRQLLEYRIWDFQSDIEFIIFAPSETITRASQKAPKFDASSLVLMQLKMSLDKCSTFRLQQAGYFLNVFSREACFKFVRSRYGPYADSIGTISKALGEFQKLYGIHDTRTTFTMVSRIICSKNTDDTFNRLLPSIDRASQYVNNILSDSDLEAVSTVLYLINDSHIDTKEQLIVHFRSWSEDKADRFTENDILSTLVHLESTGIITKDASGRYHISDCL